MDAPIGSEGGGVPSLIVAVRIQVRDETAVKTTRVT